jgi:hypothetical protein
MITSITGSDGVFVENGQVSLPYHTPISGDTFSGVLRLNNGSIQYWSNGSWLNLPTSYPTIRIDSNIVNWVRDKMTKEAEQKAELDYLKRRAEEHPSLKKAYEAIIRAEERLNRDIDKAVEDFKLLDKLVGTEQAGEYEESVAMQAP